MAKSRLVKANEKIAQTVVNGFSHIENTVVKGYTRIEDRFVEAYLTREGETVAEAKERLRAEQEQRERLQHRGRS